MKTNRIRAYTRFLPILVLAGCALEGATQSDRDETVDEAAEEQPEEGGIDAAEMSPELLDAMSHDLGIAHDEAIRLLAFEDEAARTEEVLTHDLGDAFAGAWLNERKDRLVVGITDSAVASRVRELGAEPLLVSRSLAELEEARAVLEESAPDPRIHEWYVDGPTNSLVVHADGMDQQAVQALFGLHAPMVTVVASEGRPELTKKLVGGDQIRNRDGRAVYTCTVGFAVHGGFVTAGHCLKKGEVIRNAHGVKVGTGAGSVFPGADMAWVKTNDDWDVAPKVKTRGGELLGIKGARPATVGSSVCRFGITTGWGCGTIKARNVTINAGEGRIPNTVRTTLCALPGDSGGPYISGRQAQGVASAGTPGRKCRPAMVSYFFPIRPILERFNLKLKKAD
jgi:streptogrisin C